MEIREYRPADFDRVRAIINQAAEAYRGVIPADRWHEPYMGADELQAEIEAGVAFRICLDDDGKIAGAMGAQPVQDVLLIRHAYIDPALQRRGVGNSLITNLLEDATRPVLVGTWKAASWAIAFYRKHEFEALGDTETARLLRKYWDIPDRQIETSIVLADPVWTSAQL